MPYKGINFDKMEFKSEPVKSIIFKPICQIFFHYHLFDLNKTYKTEREENRGRIFSLPFIPDFKNTDIDSIDYHYDRLKELYECDGEAPEMFYMRKLVLHEDFDVELFSDTECNDSIFHSKHGGIIEPDHFNYDNKSDHLWWHNDRRNQKLLQPIP